MLSTSRLAVRATVCLPPNWGAGTYHRRTRMAKATTWWCCTSTATHPTVRCPTVVACMTYCARQVCACECFPVLPCPYSTQLTLCCLCVLWIAQMDCHIVAFDYRGYGDSKGVPSEAGLGADARAAWNFALDLAARENQCHVSDASRHVVVLGHSLGTGVSTGLVEVRRAHRRTFRFVSKQ